MAAAGGASIGSKILGVETLVPESHRVEAVSRLLELGADIDAMNNEGNTALHAASFVGFGSMAKFLVSHGAKVNPRNRVGDTPLRVADGYEAVMAIYYYKDVADLLRSVGGTSRQGPPANYSNIEYGAEKRRLLEERAALVNQIEAIEAGPRAELVSANHADLQRLKATLASKDQALKVYEDAGLTR
jgi:hypothetical protein